ncbi:hypothetical protein TTHERM_00059400 (macronuclear) [Tetrahymena thermophila SB210]|uniref:Uncharacterized protein n=1 Tax=Tetrahymena thermophila (strain SB210) TaxID=312017 RepID=I7MHD6_TETTS|nr:hypothetical protein TTHERM_00059400 [Tetrahymena thermophila SB210]EAR87427.1 hypothetical protein TTHERM_00059400 [Tetrahymena thermophila SB210]|eukprot:XP_001007672.1 hypothetical protein TTHERM_00059400 [Tetrahymena thermophila SB210]
MSIKSKKRGLNNSYSTSFLAVTQVNGFQNSNSAAKLTLPAFTTNSAQKSSGISFYSHRGSSIGMEPRKKRNLGVNMNKLDLPDRLVQQKELFNEMRGWFTQVGQKKSTSYSQQNTRRSFNQRFQHTQNSYYQPNHLSSSMNQSDQLGIDKKKPNFYDHKNIFRVKDFSQLKNNEEKIAQSIDDPITIAQRRQLIQEFEMKVQQFLKMLKIKKELGAKSHEKSYKTVLQSMGGLNNLNINLQNRAPSSQSIYQNQNNINVTQNSAQKESQHSSNQNSNRMQNINFFNPNIYPSNQDSIISQNAQLKQNKQQLNSSLQQNTQQEFNISNDTSLMSKNNINQNSGYKQGSFIDRNKDIEWQYNTYYQINQHQFQELSQKQLSFLTNEEREQYFLVLNHFKSVGHRFQVQVVVQNQNTEQLENLNDDLQKNSILPSISQKSKIQPSQVSNSRLALHQRLQDYILERCRNYLNSDNTNYDEKLKMMKKQYEQMLANFDKKSYRIQLPPNIRPRNQDFNDYYIYEDPDQLKDIQRTLQSLAEENFGSMLSIHTANNESANKTQDNQMLIEDELSMHSQKLVEEPKTPEKQETDNEEVSEESSYIETPYSQKKARNKMKFERAQRFQQNVQEEDPQPQPKPPKQKKKKPPQNNKNMDDEEADKRRNTIGSSASDQSDDSGTNFSKTMNQRFRSGSSIDSSPQPRVKQSPSYFNKKVNSPKTNKSAQANDSENEDKIEDPQNLNDKKAQARSQFSKRAQPPSSNPSKRTIKSISEVNPDSIDGGTKDKQEDQSEQKDPNSPKSIDLSLSFSQNTGRKARRKNSDDSGGFEQAQDDLEDLEDRSQQQQNDFQGNQNQNQNKSFDLNESFDLNKSQSKRNTNDNKNQGSKKNINTNQQGGNNNSKTSNMKERPQSNSSNKSKGNMSSSQNQNKNQTPSSFRQKIQDEIRREEEKDKIEEDIQMETVILGTGLFDRILANNNYLDFDIKKYYPQNKNKNSQPIQNAKLQKEQDQIIFQKFSLWEQEVHEENESYGRTQDDIVESLLRVQNDYLSKKNKGNNMKSQKTNSFHSQKINTQSNKSEVSIKRSDSIIENSQMESQRSPNQRETSFFGNQQNYTREKSNSKISERSVKANQNSPPQSPNLSRLNSSINKSQSNEYQSQISQISATGKSYQLNLSKLGQKNSKEISSNNKKKFKTSPSGRDTNNQQIVKNDFIKNIENYEQPQSQDSLSSNQQSQKESSEESDADQL